MVALAIKTMEIVAARIDGPPGRQGAMCGAGKRQTPDPAGRVSAIRDRPAKASGARHLSWRAAVALLVVLPTIRVIFAKQKQKAPESVRTSGIALRRLWALRFYNREARLWFHPTSCSLGQTRDGRGCSGSSHAERWRQPL